MSKVYLLKYNNYYNRIVKKENSLTDYFQYLVGGQGSVDSNGSSNVIDNCNFVDGNYINTSLVVNWVGEKPNYIVVSEDGSTVASRWFVTNIVMENFAQNKLSLQRDVIVDHYDTIIGSPAFIEKGTPLTLDDSAIYNNEAMSFNQIKTKHEPIKDELGIPWIIGYIPQNSFPDADKTVQSQSIISIDKFYQNRFDEWILYPYWYGLTGTTTKYINPPDQNNIYYTIIIKSQTPFYDQAGALISTTKTCYVQIDIPWKNPMNYRVFTMDEQQFNSYGALDLAYNPGYGVGGQYISLHKCMYVAIEVEYLVSKAYYNWSGATGLNGMNCVYYEEIMNTLVNRLIGNVSVSSAYYSTYGNSTQQYLNQTVNISPFGTDLFSYEEGIKSNWTGNWKSVMWQKIRTTWENGESVPNPVASEFDWIDTGKNISFSDQGLTLQYGVQKASDYYHGTVPAYNSGKNPNYPFSVNNSTQISLLNETKICGWIYKIMGTLGHYGRWYAPSGKNSNTVTITPMNTILINGVTSAASYTPLLLTYKTTYDTIIRKNLLEGSYRFTIPKASKRMHLADQPYDMFCMPLTNGGSLLNLSAPEFSRDKQMQAALELAATIGSDNLYDVQIVPYCPFREYMKQRDNGEWYLDTSQFMSNDKVQSYNYVLQVNPDESTTTIGIMYWSGKANFSFNIQSPIQEDFITIQDKKVANETQFYRIVSPGGAAMFDFSGAKNNGLHSFNIDVLYTPFVPYIRVAPNFDGLYNKDFNDFRGLLCNDDLSLPQRSSAWTDYQVQNKNYQLQYNRQVQNLEISQDVERTQQKWQWAAGTVQGAMQGYQIGSQSFMGLGGLFGLGAAGAAAGGTFAYKAGEADYNASEILRNENLNYMKDMFQMNMQNIQALPNTITKGSILSPNFQYFPVLEKYECSEEEVKALLSKLKYAGYTVQRIGTIAIYSNPDNPYLQGYLIRYEGDDANFAIIQAINNELKMGVYLNEYTELSS